MEESERADDAQPLARGRRGIRVRLVRQGPQEQAFDRAFWRELGGPARLEALWDMVLEVRAWRGEPGDQPRLQRSALRLRRA